MFWFQEYRSSNIALADVQNITYYLTSLNLENEDIKTCLMRLLYGLNKAASFLYSVLKRRLKVRFI